MNFSENKKAIVIGHKYVMYVNNLYCAMDGLATYIDIVLNALLIEEMFTVIFCYIELDQILLISIS